MAGENKEYLSRAWTEMRAEKGWLRPIAIMALARFVPIFGDILSLGFFFEWAREAAWGFDRPMPSRFSDRFGGTMKLGLIAWFTILIWSLIGAGLNAALTTIPYLGYIFISLGWVLVVIIVMISLAAAMRGVIYGSARPAFQIGQACRMSKRNAGGLARIFCISLLSLVVLIVGLALILIFLLCVLTAGAFHMVLSDGIAELMEAGSALSMRFISMLPVIVIFSLAVLYLMNMGGLVVSGLTIRALGYWAAEFDVQHWGGQRDPIPQPRSGGVPGSGGSRDAGAAGGAATAAGDAGAAGAVSNGGADQGGVGGPDGMPGGTAGEGPSDIPAPVTHDAYAGNLRRPVAPYYATGTSPADAVEDIVFSAVVAAEFDPDAPLLFDDETGMSIEELAAGKPAFEEHTAEESVASEEPAAEEPEAGGKIDRAKVVKSIMDDIQQMISAEVDESTSRIPTPSAYDYLVSGTVSSELLGLSEGEMDSESAGLAGAGLDLDNDFLADSSDTSDRVFLSDAASLYDSVYNSVFAAELAAAGYSDLAAEAFDSFGGMTADIAREQGGSPASGSSPVTEGGSSSEGDSVSEGSPVSE